MESKDILTLVVLIALITGAVVIIKACIAACLNEKELNIYLAMRREENARLKIFVEAMRRSSAAKATGEQFSAALVSSDPCCLTSDP
jgi:NADP-dependent 3-hydroxy acid dehydrogenase YdfG